MSVGEYVEGAAYYHELDIYYPVVGVLLEYETVNPFSGTKDTQWGFFAAKIAERFLKKAAPFNFEEGNRASYHFYNGLGDHIEVSAVLKDEKAVAEAIEAEGLNIHFFDKEA